MDDFKENILVCVILCSLVNIEHVHNVEKHTIICIFLQPLYITFNVKSMAISDIYAGF